MPVSVKQVDDADVNESDDCEEAIDEIGMGIFHWKVYIIVGLFTAADSVEIGFISFVTEVLEVEWGLGEGTKATMESMIFVGMLLGAPTWGWLADKYGRQPIMILSAAVVSLFGFLTAICQNGTQLIPCRFMVGFSCAGCVVAFDVFAELLPNDWRGPLTMSTFYWFTAGALYSNVAAKFLLCSYGWRIFTVVCALPTLVAAIAGYFMVPESAHWLVAEKRGKEAAKVLNRIAKQNGSDRRFKMITMPPILEEVGTLDLFRRSKLRKPLILMMLVWIGWGLAYYGIALLLPHLFSAKKAEGGEVRLLEEKGAQDCYGITFDFVHIGISNLGQALGLTAGVLMVNRIGRVYTQVILYLIAAVFAIGLGFPQLPADMLTVFSAVALASVNGASSCTWSHTPELFPTHARVLATGICSAAARVGAASSPYVISDLIPPFPTALIMAAFSAMAAFFVFFVRETSARHFEDVDINSSESESEQDDESPDDRE
eukprot:TRINITY_DN95236_c0_g1_i1.p1 TRINITY_DN95236_c0_g1~~TRINITY_DN95236_c0_g1_i1.p1  ORF type:complete len:509 (-),score=99.62 TRINITY_DN95236_c0_g1_i1:94-1554(-)